MAVKIIYPYFFFIKNSKLLELNYYYVSLYCSSLFVYGGRKVRAWKAYTFLKSFMFTALQTLRVGIIIIKNVMIRKCGSQPSILIHAVRSGFLEHEDCIQVLIDGVIKSAVN